MRPGDRFLKKKAKAVHDEHLIRREIYNPNNFDLIFKRNKEKDFYVSGSKIPLGPEYLICKPNDWVILPHGYFIPYGKGLPDGHPVKCVINFGDKIGVGNKLPSAPITEKRYF